MSYLFSLENKIKANEKKRRLSAVSNSVLCTMTTIEGFLDKIADCV
jgi:hypothetical protein